MTFDETFKSKLSGLIEIQDLEIKFVVHMTKKDLSKYLIRLCEIR
jgi:hypothetical protein